MNKSINIGRYLPYNSFIHHLDPRVKLVTTLLFVIYAMLANNFATYLSLTVILLLEIILAKIPLKSIARGVRPMLSLLLFTAFFQMIFSAGNTVYFSFGWLEITQEGLIHGLFIFLRFSLILIKSLLLTLTTQALLLTDAIDYLLIPLKKIGFSVEEVPIMLSIGLRFIPTLLDEAKVIMDAQKLRGMDFTEGNILQRIQKFTPILVPLFNRSYDRAFDLAMAMDSRDYQGGRGRTKYHKLSIQAKDLLVVAVYIILLLLILYLRH